MKSKIDLTSALLTTHSLLPATILPIVEDNGLNMINWSQLQELRNDVGEEGFDEVIEIFLEDVQETLEHLTGTLDPAEIEADMHILKGCALNLGFENFSALCNQGEHRAASGQADQIDLEEILTVYQATKTLLLNCLKNQIVP